MNIDKEINEAFNLDYDEDEIIQETKKFIIEILSKCNIYSPDPRCKMVGCQIYNITCDLIKFNITSDPNININKLSSLVNVCVHGVIHNCNEVECSRSILSVDKKSKYCEVTNIIQQAYSSYTVSTVNVMGNAVNYFSGVTEQTGFINNSYKKYNNNDSKFNEDIEEKEDEAKTIFKEIEMKLTNCNRNRNKRNDIVKLNLTKREINYLMQTFLLQKPIYSFHGIGVYLSSHIFYLNILKYYNSMRNVISFNVNEKINDNKLKDISESLKLLLSFGNISFLSLYKLNTKHLKRNGGFKAKYNIYINLIEKMELILNKVLPGVSRFIYKKEKIIELHKAFFMKYLQRIYSIKPVIHTDHNNKVIYRKYGRYDSYIEYLKIFNFDKYWFETQFFDFPSLKLRCKYIRKCLLLYMLRELCSKNSLNKKIDPSEHCIAFLDLSNEGFSIKKGGYSHVIIKKDLYLLKNLERLNKLTIYGFNKSSHNKGLKGIMVDLNFLISLYGPTAIYNWLNET